MLICLIKYLRTFRKILTGWTHRNPSTGACGCILWHNPAQMLPEVWLSRLGAQETGHDSHSLQSATGVGSLPSSFKLFKQQQLLGSPICKLRLTGDRTTTSIVPTSLTITENRRLHTWNEQWAMRIDGSFARGKSFVRDQGLPTGREKGKKTQRFYAVFTKTDLNLWRFNSPWNLPNKFFWNCDKIWRF